jgi:hypothetical protein
MRNVEYYLWKYTKVYMAMPMPPYSPAAAAPQPFFADRPGSDGGGDSGGSKLFDWLQIRKGCSSLQQKRLRKK